MPYLLPKLGWFRYTPIPKIVVAADGNTMFLVNHRLEVMYLRLRWRRWLPELFGRHNELEW
jgi:hypothetical protein